MPESHKETSRKIEPEVPKPIKFLNVANEGTRVFTFVHCPTRKLDMILYAWVNNYADFTHAQLFQQAVEEHEFNEKYEPVGGGIIFARTCEYLPSIFYGEPSPRIIKAALNKAHCQSS